MPATWIGSCGTTPQSVPQWRGWEPGVNGFTWAWERTALTSSQRSRRSPAATTRRWGEPWPHAGWAPDEDGRRPKDPDPLHLRGHGRQRGPRLSPELPAPFAAPLLLRVRLPPAPRPGRPSAPPRDRHS